MRTYAQAAAASAATPGADAHSDPHSNTLKTSEQPKPVAATGAATGRTSTPAQRQHLLAVPAVSSQSSTGPAPRVAAGSPGGARGAHKAAVASQPVLESMVPASPASSAGKAAMLPKPATPTVVTSQPPPTAGSPVILGWSPSSAGSPNASFVPLPVGPWMIPGIGLPVPYAMALPGAAVPSPASSPTQVMPAWLGLNSGMLAPGLAPGLSDANPVLTAILQQLNAAARPVSATDDSNPKTQPACAFPGFPLLIEHCLPVLPDLCKDQVGSRWVQWRYSQGSAVEQQLLVDSITAQVLQLAHECYGNYVVQALLTQGTPEHRRAIAGALRTHWAALAKHTYGCRVVQRALVGLAELPDEQNTLCEELKKELEELSGDVHGNHVIQKCVLLGPQHQQQALVHAMLPHLMQHAMHPCGCRVVQRLLELRAAEPGAPLPAHDLAMKLAAHALELMFHQYGNYVAQHVLQFGSPEAASLVCGCALSHLPKASRHKFASNVVEKALVVATAEQVEAAVQLLLAPVHSYHGSVPRVRGIRTGDGPLLEIHTVMVHPYGNYVLQGLLRKLEGDSAEQVASLVSQQRLALRRSGNGKHLLQTAYGIMHRSS